MCPVETQRKVLESDIFRILEFEGVTETGILYKISPSKFVLVFESKVVMEKLQGTEIRCRFGDSEVCLNFRKRIGPLRNRKEPIFVTILLPEFISDQTVRLAFSNFGEVISVFKGRHNFNRFIRNWKRYVRIFPTGGDPAISINYPAMSINFFPWQYPKGCPSRGKGGVVLQEQNSSHAWRELSCYHTHSKRFQHVFHHGVIILNRSNNS